MSRRTASPPMSVLGKNAMRPGVSFKPFVMSASEPDQSTYECNANRSGGEASGPNSLRPVQGSRNLRCGMCSSTSAKSFPDRW